MDNAVKAALDVIDIETEAVKALQELICSEEFRRAVELILASEGRVIVSGMGKSGIIGRKIAATLSSTGTPSIFLHPAEALHGDLGVVRKVDVFVLISNSGNTSELVSLLPSVKLFGNPSIALTSNRNSTLARDCDVALVYGIKEEGCPLGLAPMASTTATLVLGDSLAAALMKAKGFKRDDFARFHPSGSLGRKLLTRVRDLMRTPVPAVCLSDNMQKAVQIMIETNLGAVVVVDENAVMQGLISDGDIKRLLSKNPGDLLSLPVTSAIKNLPVTIDADEMAESALRIMENKEKQITVMPVMENGIIVGLIRLHDIVTAKIQ